MVSFAEFGCIRLFYQEFSDRKRIFARAIVVNQREGLSLGAKSFPSQYRHYRNVYNSLDSLVFTGAGSAFAGMTIFSLTLTLSLWERGLNILMTDKGH